MARNDWDKLRWWQALMKSGDLALAAVSEAQSRVVFKLIEQGFDTETDPYGKKWKRLSPRYKKWKDKHYPGKKILGREGRLRQRWRIRRPTKKGFLVEPGVDYAAPHQAGTGRLPKRKMVPDGKRRLPKLWRSKLSQAAVAAMEQHFNKKK